MKDRAAHLNNTGLGKTNLTSVL